MSEQVKVNQVKLSGVVKRIYSEDEGGGFVLVDPGTTDSRWIPCTIFKSRELMGKLKTFAEDDYIQIVGMVRAWSKSVENEEGKKGYQNRVEVRITSIANKGTAAEKNKARAAQQSRFQDEDIPF